MYSFLWFWGWIGWFFCSSYPGSLMTGQLGTRLVGTARLLASLAMWSFIWASSWHSGPRKGLHIHRGRSCEASWGLGSGLCTTSLLPHSIGKASLRASLVLRGCRFHLWLEELQSHKGPCILEGKDFVLVTQSTTISLQLAHVPLLGLYFPSLPPLPLHKSSSHDMK